MIKIDLITGFLGAGKTTFIKEYARHLIGCGYRIGILENDYGAVNVDMMLLQDIEGDSCELEMVAGGCDCGCHRRRFKTKLISMGMSGYDRVLVEPSGIFDADEFFDVLYEEPLNQWYEIGNVIAVVDAGLEDSLSEQSEYLLASQTAVAGQIVLSRVPETSEDEIAGTIAHLNRAMERFQCKRRFQDDVLKADWRRMSRQDWAAVSHCGYRMENYVKMWADPERAYSSLYYMHVRMPEPKLRATVEKLMEDTSCGRIFRIKGFMMIDEERWIELNATHKKIDIQPIPRGQEIVIVIGENLLPERIHSYWE